MICLECKKEIKSIGYKHLKSCSNITVDEYKTRHPGTSLMDDDIKAKCCHFADENSSYNAEIHKQKNWIRICSCGRKVKHKSYESYRKCLKNNTCVKCIDRQCWLGKKHSKESRAKISAANKGKEYNKSRLGVKESVRTRKRKSRSLKGRKPGFSNKQHSEETKLKMRLKRIEDLKNKFGQIYPNYNQNACRLFEEINSEMGWDGQHAERRGEYEILGYFLDFYEATHNVVIEFDEKKHEIPSHQKKDIEKQQLITKALRCKFYRIKEGEENNWINILK